MKKYSLLVIDNAPDNLRRLARAVAVHMPECDTVGAASAAEGLELAQSRPFDGALIDGQLPEMDGVALCRRLKSQEATRHLPVLLIAARESTSQWRSEGLDAGADGFLTRPIDDIELIARIRAMLRLRQAEQELRQHQEQLAHVSRITTMSEMGTSIAHELSQPLCAIVTTAQACRRLLKADGNNNSVVLDAMDRITTQAKRAGEIIHHLREFSRRRPVHRSTIDLQDVLHNATLLVGAEMRAHNVRVRLNLPHRLPLVIGDTIQIEQVLVNLMRNAIESMQGIGPGGELDISISLPQTDVLEVAVRDTGRGLPENGPEQLFEPFFSTKPEGTGIGLCVSRSIIEAHGGRLWATPADGRGAVFHFTLPTGGSDVGQGACERG